MSEKNSNLGAEEISERHLHQHIEIILDGAQVISPRRRLNGRQIRELGNRDRVEGFKTEIVTGHVRVIADHEEIHHHHH